MLTRSVILGVCICAANFLINAGDVKKRGPENYISDVVNFTHKNGVSTFEVKKDPMITARMNIDADGETTYVMEPDPVFGKLALIFLDDKSEPVVMDNKVLVIPTSIKKKVSYKDEMIHLLETKDKNTIDKIKTLLNLEKINWNNVVFKLFTQKSLEENKYVVYFDGISHEGTSRDVTMIFSVPNSFELKSPHGMDSSSLEELVSYINKNTNLQANIDFEATEHPNGVVTSKILNARKIILEDGNPALQLKLHLQSESSIAGKRIGSLAPLFIS